MKCAKGFDVVQRDGAAFGIEGLAQIQITKGARKRMVTVADLGRSRHPLFANRGQNVGAALNGGALHVMHHAADAAQLFATARAARSAMHHMGQGRTVACRLGHRRSVVEVKPTVERARANCHLPRNIAVIGNDACDQ